MDMELQDFKNSDQVAVQLIPQAVCHHSQGQIGLGQAIPNFLYIQLSKMALKSFLPKTEHHS